VNSTVGAEITSNSSINVTTDVTVGNTLTLQAAFASGGLKFGTILAPQIYCNPVGNTYSLHLHTPSGNGIYANGRRIDVNPVIVFI
jgi:hypothetical protein